MITAEHLEQLMFYVEAFQEIRKRVNDDGVACLILQELAKDLRTTQIQQVRQERDERQPSGPKPATLKQLEYLRRLGVSVEEGITKQKASMMIQEAMSR